MISRKHSVQEKGAMQVIGVALVAPDLLAMVNQCNRQC
jgi:hypothetical protein